MSDSIKVPVKVKSVSKNVEVIETTDVLVPSESSAGSDFFRWEKKPSSIGEALDILKKEIEDLKKDSSDIIPPPNDAHSQVYAGENLLSWPKTKPGTTGAALDEVSYLVASLRSDVGEIASEAEGFDEDHWVDAKPTTIMEALNRIAARLNAGGTGPIA